MSDQVGGGSFFGHRDVLHGFQQGRFAGRSEDGSTLSFRNVRPVSGPSALAVTAHDLLRIADVLADTEDTLAGAILDVVGAMPRPEEEAQVESDLSIERSLFRCGACRRWLPTSRIDPDKEEWCYACAREWEESQNGG